MVNKLRGPGRSSGSASSVCRLGFCLVGTYILVGSLGCGSDNSPAGGPNGSSGGSSTGSSGSGGTSTAAGGSGGSVDLDGGFTLGPDGGVIGPDGAIIDTTGPDGPSAHAFHTTPGAPNA